MNKKSYVLYKNRILILICKNYSISYNIYNQEYFYIDYKI